MKDTCTLPNCGVPGSEERIAAYAKFYAENPEGSPFSASTEDMADALVATLLGSKAMVREDVEEYLATLER